MSYADNLYSADDSDLESFSNELSPTDGYFSNRDHPQAVMVPDPSLETGATAADSKAREAMDEATASSEYPPASRTSSSGLPSSSPLRVGAQAPATTSSPSSPTSYTPRSPTFPHGHSDDLYSESSPLLHSAVPPPAYSAAASQPLIVHSNTNYSRVSANQLESGTRGPESMGGPDDFNERSPLWIKQVQRLPRWRLFRNIVLVALVLGLSVGFIIAAVKSGESNKNQEDSSPGKSPTGPEGGHGSYCSSGSIHDSSAMPTYEFESGKELVILQVTGGDNFSRGASKVRTAGEIILRRLDESKADQSIGYITFDVWLSERGIAYRLEMDPEAQALKVVSSDSADLSPGWDHCLSIEITVWIPPGASFETILIEATSLSIRFMDDVDFHVSQHSKMETYSGDVYFPSENASLFETSKPSARWLGFSSTEIRVGTSSGDITGTVLLYDLVHIETDSGNIDITVIPEPTPHDGGSSVAQLTLGASSGDIRCHFPIWNESNIPDRDYHTSVRTHSGDISGDYVIGTEASFKVTSGEIKIIALPTTLESSSFKTETNSGSTHVTVLEPLSRHQAQSPPPTDFIDIGDDDPYLTYPPQVMPIDSDALTTQSVTNQQHLKHLKSFHDCTSGDMKIHYPTAWDGEITAVTISGSIKVGGDGVRTIRDSRKNWAYHEVVARKGINARSASSLNVHGVSGNLDVWVGEG